MQVVGTTVNMGDGGRSSDINNSSSIGDLNNQPTLENVESFNTTAYQTNNTNNTYDVEELDLSLDEQETTPVSSEIGTVESVEQPDDRSFLTKVGDWFVQAGKDIYNTGAKVVSDVKTWWSENMLGAGSTLSETAANVAHNISAINGKLAELFGKGVLTLFSTGCVVLTSIVSGVAKLVEHVVDGVTWAGAKLFEGATWLAGKIAGVFDKDAENAVMNWREGMKEGVAGFIGTDWVGKANDAIYNSKVGKGINDYSLIKYDSKIAKGIQNVTEKAAEIAAATALTIVTGGGALPALAGMAIVAGAGAATGIGKQAEKTIQGGGTLDDGTLQILLSGGLTAMSWVATGKLGAGAIQIGKNISLLGVKDVAIQMKSELLTKSAMKAAIKKGLASKSAIMNYVSSAAVVADDTIPIITGEEKLTWKSGAKIGLKFLGALGINVLEDTLRDYITGFTISDENAAKVASKIVDPNDRTKIRDLNGLNRESLGKIYGNMTPRQKLDALFADAQEAAQGKYKEFFKGFREHAAQHSAYVRDYAMKIGEECGLDSSQLAEIYYGGQYHDLGMKGGLYRDADGLFRPVDGLGKTEVTLDEVDKFCKKQAAKVLNIDADDVTKDQLRDFMRDTYHIDDWTNNKVMSEVPQELQDQVYFKRVTKFIEENLDPEEAAKYAGAKTIEDIPEKLREASYSYTTATLARANHPLNSAVYILTEDMTPKGVNKYSVALLAMSHSKSTSGIRNFENPDEWRGCVTRLAGALKEAGVSDEEIARMTKELNKTIDNPTTFTRLVDEALCIRDGDAMSDLVLKGSDTLMQDGGISHVEYTGRAKLDPSLEDTPVKLTETGEKYDDLRDAAKKAEIRDIDDVRTNVAGEKSPVYNGFSRKIHAGEYNVEFDSHYTRGGLFGGTRDYIGIARIKEPTNAPYSTIDAIAERAAEVATYGNCNTRGFEVHLPKSIEGSDLAKWYMREIEYMATSESAGKSQKVQDFYDSIKVIFD